MMFNKSGPLHMHTAFKPQAAGLCQWLLMPSSSGAQTLSSELMAELSGAQAVGLVVADIGTYPIWCTGRQQLPMSLP